MYKFYLSKLGTKALLSGLLIGGYDYFVDGKKLMNSSLLTDVAIFSSC